LTENDETVHGTWINETDVTGCARAGQDLPLRETKIGEDSDVSAGRSNHYLSL